VVVLAQAAGGLDDVLDAPAGLDARRAGGEPDLRLGGGEAAGVLAPDPLAGKAQVDRRAGGEAEGEEQRELRSSATRDCQSWLPDTSVRNVRNNPTITSTMIAGTRKS
jgi:hypothetical protein